MDNPQHENETMKEIIVDVNVIENFNNITIEERQRAYDEFLETDILFVRPKRPTAKNPRELLEKAAVVELPDVWTVKDINFTTRKATIVTTPATEHMDISELVLCSMFIDNAGKILKVLPSYFIHKQFAGMDEEQANASSINASIDYVARDTATFSFGSNGNYTVMLRGKENPVDCTLIDTRRFLKAFDLDPIELKESLSDKHAIISTDVGGVYYILATDTPAGKVSLITLRRTKDMTHPDNLIDDSYFLDSPIVSAAACSPTGLVVPSVRHSDELFHDLVDYVKLHDLDENLHYWQQGFINTRREFLTRKQAWLVAVHNDQVKNKLPCDDACRLYSENLY